MGEGRERRPDGLEKQSGKMNHGQARPSKKREIAASLDVSTVLACN